MTTLAAAWAWILAQVKYYLLHLLIGAILALFHWHNRIKSKESSMFEGKEVDQKIGSVGSVGVDVRPDLIVVADIALGDAKSLDLLTKVPGALTLEYEVKATGKLKGDIIAVALAELGSVDNAIVKVLVAELQKWRAGQEIHPEIAAAAAKAQ